MTYWRIHTSARNGTLWLFAGLIKYILGRIALRTIDVSFVCICAAGQQNSYREGNQEVTHQANIHDHGNIGR